MKRSMHLFEESLSTALNSKQCIARRCILTLCFLLASSFPPHAPHGQKICCALNNSLESHLICQILGIILVIQFASFGNFEGIENKRNEIN